MFPRDSGLPAVCQSCRESPECRGEHSTFAGGAAIGDREAEDFVVTRFQHSF